MKRIVTWMMGLVFMLGMSVAGGGVATADAANRAVARFYQLI